MVVFCLDGQDGQNLLGMTMLAVANLAILLGVEVSMANNDRPKTSLKDFLDRHKAIVSAIWRQNWANFAADKPSEAASISNNASSFEFAAAMVRQVEQRRQLTKNQMEAVHKCMDSEDDE
jgi:hypothetical protein